MRQYIARPSSLAVFRRLFACCLLLVFSSGAFAAAAGDTRTQYVDEWGMYGEFVTVAWTTTCTNELFGGYASTTLSCRDNVASSPPRSGSASISTSAIGTIGRLKFQGSTAGIICGYVSSGLPTHCWSHTYNGQSMTTVTYQGAQPDADHDLLINTYDTDDDNDGVPDTADADPLNASILCTSGNWWNGSSCTAVSTCNANQYQSAVATQRADTQCAALTPVAHCSAYAPAADACTACDVNYDFSGGACLPSNTDTDHDTLPDWWELANGHDPLKADYMVSAGGFHSCALDNTGVKCWGNYSYGQTAVPALSSPSMVSAGYRHTCAIDASGVKCWGAGVTNTGTGDNWGQSITPTLINPTAVSAGYWHTCAIDAAGVQCWGKNDYGQTTVPLGLVNPVLVSAGKHHTCALDATGVHCWGGNYVKQLVMPALVLPSFVSAGDTHTCAVDSTGVKCWGRNSAGQANVPALALPQLAATGLSHSCALDSGGVKCWGDNGFGQTTVPSLINPASVDAGLYHTCALDSAGVKCWGRNNVGQATVPVLDITHQ